MTSDTRRRYKLKPLGPVIQICPDCGKVDVYLDDGHDCNYRSPEEDDHLWK